MLEVLNLCRRSREVPLARLAKGVGCTAQHLSDLANGRARPSLSLLLRLAEAVGAPIIMRTASGEYELRRMPAADADSSEAVLNNVDRHPTAAGVRFLEEAEEAKTIMKARLSRLSTQGLTRDLTTGERVRLFEQLEDVRTCIRHFFSVMGDHGLGEEVAEGCRRQRAKCIRSGYHKPGPAVGP